MSTLLPNINRAICDCTPFDSVEPGANNREQPKMLTFVESEIVDGGRLEFKTAATRYELKLTTAYRIRWASSAFRMCTLIAVGAWTHAIARFA